MLIYSQFNFKNQRNKTMPKIFISEAIRNKQTNVCKERYVNMSK
jgi:hypothetical protein